MLHTDVDEREIEAVRDRYTDGASAWSLPDEDAFDDLDDAYVREGNRS